MPRGREHTRGPGLGFLRSFPRAPREKADAEAGARRSTRKPRTHFCARK